MSWILKAFGEWMGKALQRAPLSCKLPTRDAVMSHALVGLHNRDARSPKMAMCYRQRYLKRGVVEGEFNL
jgi:hypothetical protein